jgi:hypothetical protein
MKGVVIIFVVITFFENTGETTDFMGESFNIFTD